jgi:hypothetical protein
MHGYKEVRRMKRTSGILSLILALAIVVCALVCITAFAEDTAPVIKGANVVYGDEIKIAFTVDGTENDGEYGIALVESDGENYVIKYATFDVQVDGECVEYYLTQGIAPKDIDTVYSYAVVEKVGGEIKVVGEPIKYSVEKYANDRLAVEGISEVQKNLYNKILAYGEAADAVLQAEAE